MKQRKAVVLFSGGVDSTVCLHWARKNFDEAVAVRFCVGECSAESDLEAVFNWDGDETNRQALFLTIAHAYAQKIGASALVIGTNKVDRLKYSDSTESFIVSMQQVLCLGSESSVHIYAPLIDLDKGEIFKLADELGCLEEVRNCREGVVSQFTKAKRKEREKGYQQFINMRLQDTTKSISLEY